MISWCVEMMKFDSDPNYVTTTFPCIFGCSEQKYEYVPAFVKVTVYWDPLGRIPALLGKLGDPVDVTL